MGMGLSRVIKVRYEKGVLRPLESLELMEGEELIIEVKETLGNKGIRRFFGIIKTKEIKPEREEDYYEHLSEKGHISRQ